MVELLSNWFISMKVNEVFAVIMANALTVVTAIAVAFLARALLKRLVLQPFVEFVKKTPNRWDNIFIRRKVLQRITYVVPVIASYGFSFAFKDFQELIARLATGYMAIIGILVFDSILDSFGDIYRNYEFSKDRPIKGYIQTLKILLYVIGGILVIAYVTDSSPLGWLSGIGAMTAVLLVIFKDSLLGLVASVQISTNDLVSIGDWIEIPKYGADGNVIDITLYTVKVQNWDNTITNVPSYAMVSDSFKNWKGMVASGGRRIKRSLYIDMSSIKFCDGEMLERFSKIQYISDYVKSKQREIENYNREKNIDSSRKINGRHMTNVGTFRAYVTEYLRNNPYIHKEMTMMVRQLDPTDKGLPIEIYAFTNDTRWVNYESIQADIFDHILAIVTEFDLRVFQNPNGSDVRKLGETLDRETYEQRQRL